MTEYGFSFATAELKKEKTAVSEAGSGIRCPHCGAAVHEDDEICPSCGRRLVSYCTFCGAPMGWADEECIECGAPAGGINCPSCGTLSHRSFCPKCNAPVTRVAERMLEAAKADPVFKAAVEQNGKLEELELKLEQAAPAEAPQIKRELIKVTDDLNALLGQMLPPAGSTPQEQRNYFCARKVAVVTKTTRRVCLGWVCNYCGCCHDQPSECTKPYLGGKWKYEDEETTRTDYIKK